MVVCPTWQAEAGSKSLPNRLYSRQKDDSDVSFIALLVNIGIRELYPSFRSIATQTPAHARSETAYGANMHLDVRAEGTTARCTRRTDYEYATASQPKPRRLYR